MDRYVKRIIYGAILIESVIIGFGLFVKIPYSMVNLMTLPCLAITFILLFPLILKNLNLYLIRNKLIPGIVISFLLLSLLSWLIDKGSIEITMGKCHHQILHLPIITFTYFFIMTRIYFYLRGVEIIFATKHEPGTFNVYANRKITEEDSEFVLIYWALFMSLFMIAIFFVAYFEL